MKTHELQDYSAIARALHITAPSIMYRRGRTVRIISEQDDCVWHTQMDYRHYRRLVRRSL